MIFNKFKNKIKKEKPYHKTIQKGFSSLRIATMALTLILAILSKIYRFDILISMIPILVYFTIHCIYYPKTIAPLIASFAVLYLILDLSGVYLFSIGVITGLQFEIDLNLKDFIKQ